MNNTALLSFDRLCLTDANNTPLLNHATGQIFCGDKIALVGQSGSGKSLLLNALADLLPISSGTIFYEGQDINAIKPTVYRSNVILIAQDAPMINGTVLDNLALPFSFDFYKNSDKKFDKDWHIMQLAKLGKTSDFLQTTHEKLSGGERQIVNFLRALQLNPKVLLLDEPTAALDPRTAHALVNLVLDWQIKQDTAFVWITHTLEQIGELGASIWQMGDGVLTLNADLGDLT